MKPPALPTGPDRPSWASLLGAVPALYVFWAPARDGAPPLEWALTTLAFLVFLALLTCSAIYWSNERVMWRVCIAMAALAAAFSLYRPSGIIFFVFVAGIGPLAVGGRVASSAALVGAAAAAAVGAWWWRWPPDLMPYVVVAQTLLVGGAMTLVVRRPVPMESPPPRAARRAHF